MTGIKIVHNRLLGGWFVVRGPHQTPLGGRHDTRADAAAWLNKRNGTLVKRVTVNDLFSGRRWM